MKKIFLLLLTVIFIISCFSSCSKAEIKDTSNAGLYCVMFKEFVENQVDITEYRYLSFDKESCDLNEEELAVLEEYIKEYCDDNDVEYLDLDLVGLRRAFLINPGMYGEEFTLGYLLSFGLINTNTDGDGNTYYSSEINFWHGDMDGIGGRNFFIVKTDDGWYIDRDMGDGGYSVMTQ